MKLVAGLGNPGEKYQHTRHNVGFMVVDKLLEFINKKSDFKAEKKFESEIAREKELVLMKPQTFMNNSGVAVSKLAHFYKIQNQDVYVVHDDLDIRLGEYKIQLGVGPKVHNGVDSVVSNLGTEDFWRIRIGIDNRVLDDARESGESYVLGKFSRDERVILDEVIKKVVEELCKTLKIS